MFKVFRKIRLRLVQRNRTVQYGLYALGEIVFVILGVLIALHLNNKNEQRKQEEKVTSIFQEIHKELTASIEQSALEIGYFRRKDSLIHIVLSDTLTFDGYLKPKNKELASVVRGFSDFYIQENGFNNLIRNIDLVPKKYDLLVEGLRGIYGSDKFAVEYGNRIISDLIDQIYRHQRENTEWFSNREYYEVLDSAAIEYYLTSSYYRNSVAQFYSDAFNSQFPAILMFRANAIKTFRSLSETLQIETNSLRNKSSSENISDYQHYLGTYSNDTLTAKITLENGLLMGNYYENRDSLKVEIFPLSRTKFQADKIYFFHTLEMDESMKVESYTIHKGKSKRALKKKTQQNCVQQVPILCIAIR